MGRDLPRTESPDVAPDSTGAAAPDSTGDTTPDILGSPDLSNTPDAGSDGAAPVDERSLAPDEACLGSSLSTAAAQALCAWGATVLGPEGTVFQAACRDIVVDAGATPPPRSAMMVDMVVLSQATCLSRILTDSSCAYKVGQFKAGVETFKAGNCGAGAAMDLVGYAPGDASAPDARPGADTSDTRVPVDAKSDGFLGAKDDYSPPMDPGFALFDPAYAVNTARDPSLPIVLRATTGRAGTYSFGSIFKDRALGESAIRSLVTLTDMANGASIPYTIGTPISDGASTPRETVTLTPTTPLKANGWYRVIVYPGNTQSFVACRTTSRMTVWWASPTELTAPDVTDFYTYSRPMVEEVMVVYKGASGYVDVIFSEPLSRADLDANPTAEIAIDGTAYAASATSSTTQDLRVDLQTMPSTFEQITLRVPHAIKATGGGTILDGTLDNPYASVAGDLAVYTFKAAEMVLTDNGGVKRWYHAAR